MLNSGDTGWLHCGAAVKPSSMLIGRPMELPDLPDGWKMTSLIDITVDAGPVWSVQADNIHTGEHCSGKGTTPRYAILAMISRIEEGDVYGNIHKKQIDVLQILDIKPAGFDRRI